MRSMSLSIKNSLLFSIAKPCRYKSQAARALCLYEIPPQWQVHISYRFVFPHIWPYVDIVKENWKFAWEFTALRQPFFVWINGGLVIQAGANISSAGASGSWNHLVDDAIRVRTNILFNRKAKIDMVLGSRYSARISIMNAIASVLKRVQQAIFNFPSD